MASVDVEAALAAIVGHRHVLTDPESLSEASVDWRGRYSGRARCLVRPANTQELGAVVRMCAEHLIPIVPQGGNTGVCGGAVPDNSGRSIIVSLGRMNGIREIDAANNSITVDAGVVLADVHREAQRVNRLFPLDLGSSGSCQIGGNVSTNAGGIGVLKYGSMRSLVLGLEVVLPDGEVLDCLKGLRKDNSGYDLKQLFIGAEGTLGIITGVVLKLFSRPTHHTTALVGLPSCDAALDLFELCSSSMGSHLAAFELISGMQLEAVIENIPGTFRPLEVKYDWYVLLELTDDALDSELLERTENLLSGMIEAGDVSDAVIAKNLNERERLWRIRHSVSEANVRQGHVLSHDTSVPISRIGDFIRTCDEKLSHRLPGTRLHFVGHIGDGNVHVVVVFPDSEAFDRNWAQISEIVNGIALGMHGSIAAEHGIGQSLRQSLRQSKSETELRLMRLVKESLDPGNIMNPGKVL